MGKLQWPFQMLAPVLLFLAAIFFGPFLYMVWLSFTDLSFAAAERNGNLIGLSNYSEALFTDSLFLGSLYRSGLFALLCVVPEILIGVAVAELLQAKPLAQRVLSPLFALPVLLPTVVVGLYWRLLLQGEFGLVSYYLSELGVPGAKGILSSPNTVIFTLAAIDIWQWCPFVSLVILAARSSLPRAPLEAAWIDGASRWRAFVDITIPRLLPTIAVVSLIRAIDSFKEFDKVYILTGGGPGTASELSSIYTWRMAFRNYEFGYAAALCVIIYLIIYVVAHAGFGSLRLGEPR